MNQYPLYNDIQNMLGQLVQLRIERWLQYEVFSPQWWFLLVGILVVPWLIWWFLVDKKRLVEVAFHTSLAACTVTVLDAAGAELMLWGYPYGLIPILSKLTEVDLGLLPVTYSLIYQYFRPWNRFIAASVVHATLIAFVGESTLEWFHIYEPVGWSHVYSWPIYILVGILLKCVVDSASRKQRNAVQD